MRRKPTPGPWEVPGANVFRVVAPEAPHRNKPQGIGPPYPWAIVCTVDPDSVRESEAAANARLIAAAPDLLAALEGLMGHEDCEHGVINGDRNEARDAACAALARAKGETT